MPLGAPKRVLVVDDSADIHRLLTARLKSEGVEILSAFDGDAALRAVASARPDLVLLDVDLGSTSGFDLCRHLKSQEATLDIPVIFLTASNDLTAKVRGFELGAVDYVTKPFEPTELRARVRAALRTKTLLDLLASRAMVDGLTTLWNRRYFDERLAAEIGAAARHGRAVAMVLLDLDHFKRLNDLRGHPFGDRVLQAVGATIAQGVRPTDVACRYGGEEFGVILPETGMAEAASVAERIRARIGDLRFQDRSEIVTVSASFGVASSAGTANATAPLLVDRADRALYLAKQRGRDRVELAA